jgi:hypothetical protein
MPVLSTTYYATSRLAYATRYPMYVRRALAQQRVRMARMCLVKIKSETSADEYLVTLNANRDRAVACTCPGFTNRRALPGFACKHMRNVDSALARRAQPD